MGIGKENQNNSLFTKAGGIGKRLLLHRLNTIIKAIFPNHHTRNPYQIEQIETIKNLDFEDKILLKELVHSITLLNGFSRINNQNQIISTRTDLVNALQLTLPKELQLTQKSLNIHTQLLAVFKDQEFNYVQAGSRLKTSLTTLKRQFKPLITHGLIKQHPIQVNQKALFQAIKIIEKTELNTSQEIFETMQGDWKDFVGFVEF